MNPIRILPAAFVVALSLSAVSVTAAQPMPGSRSSGFRLAFSAGAFGSLTQLAPVDPIGLGLEVGPEWRTAGGFGIQAGARAIRYGSGVPDHVALHVDLRKYAGAGRTQAILGLRLGVFGGGDEEGDDPFIGFQAGPVAGAEVALSDRAALQVLGSLLALPALFRDTQVLPGLQAGIVLR